MSGEAIYFTGVGVVWAFVLLSLLFTQGGNDADVESDVEDAGALAFFGGLFWPVVLLVVALWVIGWLCRGVLTWVRRPTLFKETP